MFCSAPVTVPAHEGHLGRPRCSARRLRARRPGREGAPLAAARRGWGCSVPPGEKVPQSRGRGWCGRAHSESLQAPESGFRVKPRHPHLGLLTKGALRGRRRDTRPAPRTRKGAASAARALGARPWGCVEDGGHGRRSVFRSQVHRRQCSRRLESGPHGSPLRLPLCPPGSRAGGLRPRAADQPLAGTSRRKPRARAGPAPACTSVPLAVSLSLTPNSLYLATVHASLIGFATRQGTDKTKTVHPQHASSPLPEGPRYEWGLHVVPP